MKRNLLLLVLLIAAPCFLAKAQSKSDSIAPYSNFLSKQKTSAKDYILSLFKDKDIVILSERDHRELTQYDLILEVIKDPYFVKHVGIVYTELGAHELTPDLNTFLKSDKLTDDEVNKQVLRFQRDCMSPLWEKSSFAYFIKGFYEVNSQLPAKKKISICTSDILGEVPNPTPEKVKAAFMLQAVRDSLMALTITTNYDKRQQQTGKKKALVIMNYRHAFKQYVYTSSGYKQENVGRILTEKYPGKVANVMINNWRQVNTPAFFGLVQDGKWDAAFQQAGKDNVGFNFKGSPFGNDSFDYFTEKNDFAYNDVFDGFVFYRPINKFQMSIGLNGLMDDGFYDTFVERVNMLNNGFGRTVFPLPSKDEAMKLNETRISPMNNLDALEAEINSWLK